MNLLKAFLILALVLGIAVPAHAAVFYVPRSMTTAEREVYLEKINELRILIIKAQQEGMAVPISTLALAGQDPARLTGFTLDLTESTEKSAEAYALQHYLMRQGHEIPGGPDGYFGTTTTVALAAFQAKNGITPAKGYFGPITRAYIKAHPETFEEN